MQAKARAELEAVKSELRAMKHIVVDTMFLAWDSLILIEEKPIPTPTAEVQRLMDLGFDKLRVVIEAQLAQAELLTLKKCVLEGMLEREASAPVGKRPARQCPQPDHDHVSLHAVAILSESEADSVGEGCEGRLKDKRA